MQTQSSLDRERKISDSAILYTSHGKSFLVIEKILIDYKGF